MKIILLLIGICFSASSFAQKSDSTKLATDTNLVKAQFPSNQEGWNKYIQKLVESNIDQLVEDPKSRGTAEVEFTVAIDGTISNIKIIALEGSVLANVLYKAILNGPKWIPAMRNNEPIESKQTQKATFKVYDPKQERRERREKRKTEGN